MASNKLNSLFHFSLDSSFQTFLQYREHMQHILPAQLPPRGNQTPSTEYTSTLSELQATSALHEADTYGNNHDAVVQESESNERESVVQQNCKRTTNTSNQTPADKTNQSYADETKRIIHSS